MVIRKQLARVVPALLLIAVAATAADGPAVLRGHLAPQSRGQEIGSKQPLLFAASDGRTYRLSIDETTGGQLRDPQLADREWELVGNVQPPDGFEVLQNFTIKDGARHRVTYFCEICNIVSHTPGRCVCCQGPTELRETPRD
jgi:hypothetical protein